MNKDLNVTVVDKRPNPKRNHGLHINSDSINKINKALDEALKSNTNEINLIKELKGKFSSWKNGFIRTTAIENEMAAIAIKYGIIVERNEEFDISANPSDKTVTVDQLLDPDSENKTRLWQIFQDAHYIIGADGAHSEIRKAITGELKEGVLVDKVVDQKTMQHVIELKYQTNGKAKPRKKSQALKESTKCGHMDFESVNKKTGEEDKPVTLHIFVDKETYDKLRVKDENGKLKGVFGNSWTLADIKGLSKNDLKIRRVYETFKKHLGYHKRNGGACKNEQISTLDLTVFRSKESVKNYKGKNFVLVGDANSGMVLERGVNKGIKEAALCAEAIAHPQPNSLKNYQKKTRAIFKREKRFAEFKNFWIQIIQKVLYVFAKIVNVFSNGKKLIRQRVI